MQSEVSVRLADDQEFRFDLTSAEPMAHEAGRRWLDDQFTALDCEPLRAVFDAERARIEAARPRRRRRLANTKANQQPTQLLLVV